MCSSPCFLSSNHTDLTVSLNASPLRELSLMFPLPAIVYPKFMRVSFLHHLQVSPQLSPYHLTLDHFIWNKLDSSPQHSCSNYTGWLFIFICLSWTASLYLLTWIGRYSIQFSTPFIQKSVPNWTINYLSPNLYPDSCIIMALISYVSYCTFACLFVF